MISIQSKAERNKLCSFTGTLTQDKATLRAELALLMRVYERRGGKITVCRPGVAQGASFGRNKSPFNKLRGVDRPSIYG